MKIHAAPITKHGEIDHEGVVKLAEDFNGADLRNVCTEAGTAIKFIIGFSTGVMYMYGIVGGHGLGKFVIPSCLPLSQPLPLSPSQVCLRFVLNVNLLRERIS
ncbi:MAG: hypothetical protein MJE68_05175 [Proteobacteria bacterium]|nr:hypothetical protein [Pseudomonadota bacterium]